MASANTPTVQFDIVLYRRGPYWVGHCLQLDVLTSGTDPRAVEEDALRICVAQIQYAYQNDLLEDVLRPPNPHISRMILMGLNGDGLELRMKTEVIEHNTRMRVFVPMAA